MPGEYAGQLGELRYKLKCSEGEIELEWAEKKPCAPEDIHPAERKYWLETVLVPKLANILTNGLSVNTSSAQGFPETLSLVDKPRYQQMYNSLKIKYGLDLVQGWTEVTDPQKFVFEDIAIASYLLVLWEKLNVKGISDY